MNNCRLCGDDGEQCAECEDATNLLAEMKADEARDERNAPDDEPRLTLIGELVLIEFRANLPYYLPNAA